MILISGLITKPATCQGLGNGYLSKFPFPYLYNRDWDAVYSSWRDSSGVRWPYRICDYCYTSHESLARDLCGCPLKWRRGKDNVTHTQQIIAHTRRRRTSCHLQEERKDLIILDIPQPVSSEMGKSESIFSKIRNETRGPFFFNLMLETFDNAIRQEKSKEYFGDPPTRPEDS